MPLLEKEYIETGKVRFIYRPLGDFVKDRSSRLTAESLYCAGEQGKFWEMHDWLYANEARWLNTDDVAATFVSTAAPEIGLDGARLSNCLNQERYYSRVISFVDDATQRNIYSTPTFLVNGRLLEGALPIEQFRAAIEEALQK